jgi:hypothetical protein
MDLSKSYDYLQPENVKAPIHIVGCGAIGSTVAELLARFGMEKMTLWDFDKVEPKNIANQMFTETMIGMPKAIALLSILKDINHQAKHMHTNLEGWKDEKLDGHVFLCVDSIKLRQEFVKAQMHNVRIKTMTDFRMGLESGQIHFRNWNSLNDRKSLLETMDYTDEEAAEATPVSACGVELSVVPTVRMVANAGVANFVNAIKEKETHKLIVVNAFEHHIIAA